MKQSYLRIQIWTSTFLTLNAQYFHPVDLCKALFLFMTFPTILLRLRMVARNFWVTFEKNGFQRVIWSHEKWFILYYAPNGQTNTYRAPAHWNQNQWPGWIMDGIILPSSWFETYVSSDIYLEMVLKYSIWHVVKAVTTRHQYWFQQDGASWHVTASYLQLLSLKFGLRLIFRRTDHQCPLNSPELSSLDFAF